ncbi:MAG: hypothetical protein R2828_00830 [Saprospiraceae bacterium]
MKFTLFAFLFFFDFATTKLVYAINPATTYTVIAIRGAVKNAGNGLLLRTRSRFNQEDRLYFSSPKDKLLVVNELGQTFLCLYADTNKGFQLHPSKTPQNTRPGAPLNFLALNQYFSIDTIYVFDNQLEVITNSVECPMNKEQFFYVQFKWKDKMVNKKLSFNGDTLLISREDLYQVKGQQIEEGSVENQALLHYDLPRQVSLPISDLKLVFLNTDQLTEEISTLLDTIDKFDKETQYNKIEAFIFTYYGRTDEANFEKWLTKHFRE